MHFAVIARDHRTPGTLEKRLAARTEHMKGVREMTADGRVVRHVGRRWQHGRLPHAFGFPDREALNAYIAQEPYQRDAMWGDVEVLEVRRVDGDKLMTQA